MSRWWPSVCFGGNCQVIIDDVGNVLQVENVCQRHAKFWSGNLTSFGTKLIDHEHRVNYCVRTELPKQINRYGVVDPNNGEIMLKEGTVSWLFNEINDVLEISTNITLTQQERNKANAALAQHPEWNAILL
jgi:hypothetical protein